MRNCDYLRLELYVPTGRRCCNISVVCVVNESVALTIVLFARGWWWLHRDIGRQVRFLADGKLFLNRKNNGQHYVAPTLTDYPFITRINHKLKCRRAYPEDLSSNNVHNISPPPLQFSYLTLCANLTSASKLYFTDMM